MKKFLLTFFSCLMVITVYGQDFYFGNDLSYVNQMEDCGAVYKEGGTEKDVFRIFADHGANLVRVRLWVDPTWQNDLDQPEGVKAQYSDFEDVKETIRRAKEAGMQVLLGIHYSDVWADPGRQLIPSRWLNIASDTEALKSAVYDYTYNVLSTLDSEGLMPDIVKVGNENNSGILRHTTMDDDFVAGGSVNNDWARHAQLYNAAIRAIRAVGATASVNPKIALHYSGLSGLKSWYQRLINNGVTDFDIIGFSYYYSWHEGSIEELGQTIRDLVASFPDYETMVVETGYLWSNTVYYDNMNNIITIPDPEYLPVTPEKQLEYMVDFTREVMRSGGIGVVFWEPAWVSTPCMTPWGQGSAQEHVAFFDRDFNFMENGAGRWMESPYYQDLETVKVTFRVDMTGEDVSKGVYVTGDFPGASWVFLPMLHEGNNIYTYSTYLSPEATGAYYFLNAEESTAWDKDRGYEIPAQDVEFAYHWASCEIITPPTSTVIFKVDMTGEEVSHGVYITGDFTGAPWSLVEMINEGGNIYSYTTELEEGSSGAFLFHIGNDWNGGENIKDKECAVWWTDHRGYVVGEEDITYAYSWESCTLDGQPEEPQAVEVTFKVDMRGRRITNGVFVTGDFTGESWQIMPMEHIGGGTFAYTTTLEPGAEGAYFFLNNNNMTARETVPAECATVNGTDRGYLIPARNVEYAFSWGACELFEEPPVISGIEELLKQGKGIYPNPATDFIKVDFTQDTKDIRLEVLNYAGQTVLKLDKQRTDQAGVLKVALDKLPAGFYLLKTASKGEKTLYAKFVKE